MDDLVTAALSGDRRSIARLMSVMERGDEEARHTLAQFYPRTGQARILGVTGAPGTGKSTLVTEMAKAYRKRGLSIGIVAVDPTSPFSGGALLGDRIRMRELATDPQVFIRSMATRGSLGGLARATADVVHVLDATGYPIILVETVGAGQSEVDIARTAHTTVVVEMPAAGDDIQAIKAGILEIADILVVNKADLPGADSAVAALRAMLDLNQAHTEWHHGRYSTPRPVRGQMQQVEGVAGPQSTQVWRPPVLRTCALRGEGIEELLTAADAHWQYLCNSGLNVRRERERVADELRRILRSTLLERLLKEIPEVDVDATVQNVVARQIDPYSAAEALINKVSPSRPAM
jgi:LAO/AO transport system kinase